MRSAPPRNRRGFTLLEAMAAVVLLGIGIVGAMGAFATVTRTESSARQKERMQQLASAKLAELVATGQATTSTNGDYADEQEPDYTWSLEIGTSGITDLNTATITVTRSGTSEKAKLDTLLYAPPETTTTTAGSTTAGGTTG